MSKIYIPTYEGEYCITEASRKCLICDNKEHSLAEIVDETKPWICDNCKSALFKVINEVKRNE